MGQTIRFLGAAIALAGIEKLTRERGYVRLFKHLGWSTAAMRSVAAAETVGGILMLMRPTRRVGGAIVAAASAALLVSEMQHGDEALAAPRGLIAIAGAAALVFPGES